MTSRVLKSKQIMTDSNGNQFYEYIYEVTKPNSNQVKEVIVRNRLSKKYPVKYSKEHEETVLKAMQTYFNYFGQDLQKFHKRTELDKLLKNIVDYIHKVTQIKITQLQARTLAQTRILAGIPKGNTQGILRINPV